ncbi:MAG: 50S ribosomal protein L10 [bacterium]|nr:50S ribosomal protein L10 [bacterium]
MNLQEKEAAVDVLRDSFSSSVASIFIDYKGCTCAQITSLRRKLRPTGGKIAIVKNTLARKAMPEGQADALASTLTGPTAIIFADQDPVSPAKVVADFAKDLENVQIKGGIVDGKVISSAQVEELAKMPSKEELYSKLLYLFNAPATQLLRLINAPATQLVRTVEAWRVKLEEKGGN